jgi:hypothetical protein
MVPLASGLSPRLRHTEEREEQQAMASPIHPTQSDEKAARRGSVNLVLSERGRTIDQLKRLFAVVMGFAVTTCFINAYQSITGMIQYITFDFHVIFIVISELLSFLSLIALFFLGTERLLDSTYLNIRSDLPTHGIVLFDLIWLGLTAALFVILADTIPDRYIIDNAISHIPHDTTILQQFLKCLTQRQEDFVVILLVIYFINSSLFGLQLKYFNKRISEYTYAYRYWIKLNVVCFIIFIIIITVFPILHLSVHHNLYIISVLSVSLIFVHLVRFYFDFRITFGVYFPKTKMPIVDDIFQKLEIAD